MNDVEVPVIFEELLNDPAEVHSLVIGIHCGITNQNYKDLDITDSLKEEVKVEYPYFLAGFYGAKIAKLIKFIWRKK